MGELWVSSFYVDKYPVTYERYHACFDAGVCNLELSHPAAFNHLVMQDAPHRPIASVSWTQMNTFCDWDGGRRLLTEAEWEKAARGPAPRDSRYIWEPGDAPDCEQFPVVGCPGFADYPSDYPFDVDELPFFDSHFGTSLMTGGGGEWILDPYTSRPWALDGFESPDFTSMVVLGGEGTARGVALAARPSLNEMALTERLRGARPERSFFRCARSAPGAERDWESLIPGRY